MVEALLTGYLLEPIQRFFPKKVVDVQFLILLYSKISAFPACVADQCCNTNILVEDETALALDKKLDLSQETAETVGNM